MKHLFSILFLLPTFLMAQKYGFERSYDVPVTANSQVMDNPWAGGFNTAQFSEIDLDLDGRKDLFLFDRTSNKSITFINNGSTTGNAYDYDAEYESSFPSELRDWVLLRDFNCDGKNDIFGYSSGGMQVWKNTSNATDGLQFELITSLLLSNQNGTDINLYVSSIDIPALDDVDGDGDLDVLTFAISGGTLEYHMNMAMENNGNCDNLEFVLANKCWGHFTETSTGTNTVNLNEVCTDNIIDPKSSALHTGSTVTSFDVDGNGVKDLLLGDVSFPNVVMLTNDNIGVNANSSMVSQDINYPSYDTPIDMYLFPATYYLDVNNDNVRDLIVAPNVKNGVESRKSAQFYRNSGADNVPIFSFEQDDFLLDEMIDIGTASFPVFFDYNSDGLEDLIVGDFGKLNPSTSLYETSLSLYENTGTAIIPEYTLIDDDYLELSTLGIEFNAFPTFGDLDNDDDLDLIIGDQNGNIHLFTNTASSGATVNFSLTKFSMNDQSGNTIDVGISAYPFLFDFDFDNDLDLVIGERNGNLNYYSNIGSASSHSFSLASENFGGVSVTEIGNIVGHSTPFVFKNTSNQIQILVGSERGEIHHFDNVNGNLGGIFNHLDENISLINDGKKSAITCADINGDGKLDALIGNIRGGLSLYSENPNFTSPTSVDEFQSEQQFEVYPNPSKGVFTIELKAKSEVVIYSIEGKKIFSKKFNPGSYSIEIDSPKGLYLIRVVDLVNQKFSSRKIRID